MYSKPTIDLPVSRLERPESSYHYTRSFVLTLGFRNKSTSQYLSRKQDVERRIVALTPPAKGRIRRVRPQLGVAIPTVIPKDTGSASVLCKIYSARATKIVKGYMIVLHPSDLMTREKKSVKHENYEALRGRSLDMTAALTASASTVTVFLRD